MFHVLSKGLGVSSPHAEPSMPSAPWASVRGPNCRGAMSHLHLARGRVQKLLFPGGSVEVTTT
jgi:hypothetical protein